jgi:FHS family L-fucose permease-like MFS transporter
MLLAAVTLSILVYGVISSMLGSLLPALGFTGGQNGTLALTQASGLAIASLLAGPLIDTRGKKTAMVIGLTGIGSALFLLPSAAGNFALAAWLWFLLGLGGGTMATASNSIISDLGGARRSSILNFTNLFFGLGLMITPFLASRLFAGDVQGLCYFGAALATATLAIQTFMRFPPRQQGKRFNLAEASQLLSSPILHLFALLAFLYVSCEVGMSNWLVKYLIAKGVARDHALRILSLGFALGLLFGRVVASRVLNRVSAATVASVSAILMTLATFWVLDSGSSETVIIIAVFSAGLAMAPVYPTTLGMVGDVFPNSTGTAMGLVITAGWAGLAVSSRIIGWVAGGDESHIATALLLFPIFSCLMIGVSFIVRASLKQQSPSLID